jgi:hypothetical protein
MPDPIFAHPRLAGVYDVFDGDRSNLDPYGAARSMCSSRGAGIIGDRVRTWKR